MNNVVLDTGVDWQAGVVTFSQRTADGMALIGSPQIKVPLVLILHLAAQAMELKLPPEIRALNFQPQEVPAVNRDRLVAFDARVGPS